MTAANVCARPFLRRFYAFVVVNWLGLCSVAEGERADVNAASNVDSTQKTRCNWNAMLEALKHKQNKHEKKRTKEKCRKHNKYRFTIF